MRTIKTWWLAAAFLSGIAVAMWAEELILRSQENRIEFSAPGVHLLTGNKPVEKRIRTGKSVPFDFKVTIAQGRRERIVRATAARFVISYDVIQEDYTVNKLVAPVRAASHLTAAQAEAWCFREMSVDVSGIGAGEPIWAKVDIRVSDERDARVPGRDDISETGINLNWLLDILARPPSVEQPHWVLEAGPYTLDRLRRGRG